MQAVCNSIHYSYFTQFSSCRWLHHSGFLQISILLAIFSYQPFSADSNSNTIDPRTYFFLREFLNQNQVTGNLMLITTWMMNVDEDRVLFPKDVAMPFNVNNVDLSVCANVIYGVFRTALYSGRNDLSWFDETLQQTILNTSSLIQWAIESGRVTERPDLGLLYYPPINDLYWFISRTVFLLNNFNGTFGPIEVLANQVRVMLTSVMRGSATEQLIENSIEDADFVYWQDFIGQADISWLGYPDPHPDDRLFSTSMGLNALIDAWTQYNPADKTSLYWVKGVPKSVKNAVQKSSLFLSKYILSDQYQKFNSFFSGSVKGMEQLPFAFPANRLEYLNGTILPPDDNNPGDITSELICGMQGVMDESQYQQQLNSTHFSMPVPQQFTGFNSAFFPFWSSSTLTDATSLVAIAKAKKIQG